MARSNVPKFGNWESEDDVPYTVFFDKARKTRGEKMINPNDPLENPYMFRNIEPPPLAPAAPLKTRTKPEEPIVRGSVKQIHEHRVSREDVDFSQFSNSTGRNENMRRGPRSESSYGGRVNRPIQSKRSSAGSEYSFESSPHNPQARNTGRGIGSVPWEGTNYVNNQGIRARSRLGPIAHEEDNSHEKGAAVPRFGDWNEHDPHSAENFTLVFNKVREERNPTPGHVSNTPKNQSYSPRIQPSNEPKKCCFPWW